MMLEVTRPDVGFVAVVTIPVAGPEQQRELVELLVRDVEEWVRFCPGFKSANYHMSQDGKRVLNYAQWSDEVAYRQSFRDNPRSGALRAEIVRLSEGGPEMVGYTLRQTVVAAD